MGAFEPRAKLVLFTPGPVRIPPRVADYLANPPCNYHRQDDFRAMFERNEADLKDLIGIAAPNDYFATTITSTGTGANEACLLAMAGLGKGLIVRNGFFANRVVEQAVQNALDHVVLDLPHDRAIDPDEVARAIAAHRGLRWCFFVSHETRMGLANPLVDIGRVCKEHDLVVAADMISSAYAYPVDLEGSGIDLATASSAKAMQAVPGIGVLFVKLATLPRLRQVTRRNYYLDIVAETDKQKTEFQTRFAQPVALHAAIRAALDNLKEIGIARHFARIRRQMDAVHDHLAGMGIASLLDPVYRSWIAVNFRLPSGRTYQEFSRHMSEEGYFLLYGIPGDDTHFQVSTIGDLSDDHVSGLCSSLTRVLSR